MTGNEVIEDVYTNRADIGFIMYPAHKADKIQEILTFRHLEARPLFQSPTQFFCRVGHPILKELDNLTPEKLYQYNFVLYPSESTKTRAAESVYNDKTLQLINWNRISQVIYVNSRALLHNVIQRSDYLGIGLIPMREQVENYNIVSFPLPDWMQPEADRYGDYISAYIFQKGIQLPKAARAYITFLEQFYGPDSGYEEECSENKNL
ncbi:MAG: substrate-binding domain-containing protein [Pilosibacter sp.]